MKLEIISRSSKGGSQTLIKIRAHREEFFNEKADRWADEGQDDVDNVRWDAPSSQPIFSWTEARVKRRCSMNKTRRNRMHLKVAELQQSETM